MQRELSKFNKLVVTGVSRLEILRASFLHKLLNPLDVSKVWSVSVKMKVTDAEGSHV